MLQLLTNCTKKKLITTYSTSFSELKLPVLIYGFTSINSYSENKSNDLSNSDDDKLPEPPTNCCMSGCPNCVWVEYADKLTTHCKDGGGKARKKILEHITDENMRAYLMMELRNLEKENQK